MPSASPDGAPVDGHVAHERIQLGECAVAHVTLVWLGASLVVVHRRHVAG